VNKSFGGGMKDCFQKQGISLDMLAQSTIKQVWR